MRARLRTSRRLYEHNGKKKFRKLVKKNSFDVLGPQIKIAAKAPLHGMTPAKRKRAWIYCIIFGLAVPAFYILYSKGISLALIILGLKAHSYQIISAGLKSAQFYDSDKAIIASFLGLFALTALIVRFPEIRETIMELLRNIARCFNFFKG